MILDKADVVVVGGGVVGTSCAYFLKKAGLDVVLVEQKYLGYGASGRNAGFLWMHNRNKGIALDLAREGVKIYDEEYLPLLGNSFEYRKNGGMVYFYTEEQQKVFQEFVEARNADGIKMELIDGNTAREYAPILPDKVIGSTYSPEDAQISTPLLVRNLGHACIHDGVRIYENTSVLGMIKEGDKVTGVRTAEGEIYSDNVVIASGVWSKLLGDTAGIDIPVKPERLGVVKTTPLPKKVLNKAVYGPLAVKAYAEVKKLPSYKEEYFLSDFENPGLINLELISQMDDGSLLIGCPMDYPDNYEMKPTLDGLKLALNTFLDMLPDYKGVGVDAVWAGLLPYTPDKLPIIDKASEIDGVYVASGHVYGNIAGPITGKLISQLVCGEKTSLPLDELRIDRESIKGNVTVSGW